MFKTALVPLLGQENDKEALETAREIMLDDNGHLDCLYVRDDAAAIVSCIQTDALGVPVASPELIDALNREAEAQKARSRQAFDHFCHANGIVDQSSPGAGQLSAAWRQHHPAPQRSRLRHRRPTHTAPVIAAPVHPGQR